MNTGLAENWGNEDMEAAPEDELLRLYVQFDENPTEDIPEKACAPTIGFKDGNGCWRFAGWCWSHDVFTEGKGKPVAWLPLLSQPPRAALSKEEKPRATKKASVEHTRLIDHKMTCLHCGYEYPVSMPIPVKLMAALVDAFNDIHKDCKKESPK